MLRPSDSSLVELLIHEHHEIHTHMCKIACRTNKQSFYFARIVLWREENSIQHSSSQLQLLLQLLLLQLLLQLLLLQLLLQLMLMDLEPAACRQNSS